MFTSDALSPRKTFQCTPPSADDDTRVRDLRERLFANEALSLSGRRPMKGSVPLQAATFYTLVGRPDLVDRMRRRRIAKGITIGLGAAAMTIGTVVGIADSAATAVGNTATGILCIGNTSDPNCKPSEPSAVPWIVAFGGGALEAAKRTANVRAAVLPDGQSGMLLAGCSF